MASPPSTPDTPASEAAPPSLGDVASRLDAILHELQALNRRVDRLTDALAGRAGGEAGRDRDPGDAVPPGVAVQSPAPLTPDDEAVLQELEELPNRAPRAG